MFSGWVLGAAVALIALRYEARLARRWFGWSEPQRALVLVLANLGLWIATPALSDWSAGEPPSAFVSYAGV